METMTKNRVYVYVDENNNLKSIAYFDKSNKRTKTIDLIHSHIEKNKFFAGEHVHKGYFHSEFGTANQSNKELKMVENVRLTWHNYLKK